MTSKGCDTTVSTITVAQLEAAGMDFICRYILDAPGGQKKQITKAEVARFSAGGKLIVSNFEWAERPPDTVAEGKAHARDFLSWADDFNVPDWSPCYFSLDANNSAGAYENYFHGIADTITPERAAMYGNGACYRNLLAKGLISYAWQSKSSGYAGNSTTTGANLVQRLATASVGGHTVDVNDAKTPLFGGWLLGMKNPNTPQEPDVELTDKLSNGKTVDQALSAIFGTATNAGVWHTEQFTPKLDANGKPVVPTVYTESGSARMDRLDKMQAYVMSPKFAADIAAAIPAGGSTSPDAIAAAVTEVINRTVLRVPATS